MLHSIVQSEGILNRIDFMNMALTGVVWQEAQSSGKENAFLNT